MRLWHTAARICRAQQATELDVVRENYTTRSFTGSLRGNHIKEDGMGGAYTKYPKNTD
jgi:hypothetical protein